MKKTQKEFLRDLSSKNKNVTMESAGYVLDALNKVLFDYVKLADEYRTNIEVVIPGLGKFYTVHYGERKHFNPNTLQTETITPSTKIRFKATESLYKDDTK
jgi:nucleoid DNA-binding protein